MHQHEQQMHDGIKYSLEGDLDKAISCFTKAIELMPEDKESLTFIADPYSQRGDALRDKGNLVDAAADYDKVAELNPEDEKSQRFAKLFRAKVEHDPEALFEKEEFIKYSIRAEHNTYDHEVSEGPAKDAIENYSVALYLDPQSSDSYAGRGLAYWKIGQLDYAIADFNKAIVIDPENWFPLLSRAHVNFEKGNYDQALSDAQKVLTIKGSENEAEEAQELIDKIKKSM